MRVLLISLQSNTDTIGLKYIHSYLCKNNIDSNILFVPKYDRDFSPIRNFLQTFDPRIIGISLMTTEFNDARDLSEKIRKEFPNSLIIWGGIHPSIAPDACLKFADYVFIGESELSFLKFVNAVQNQDIVKNVPNLAYKMANKIITNTLRPLNEDLDVLPFPEHFPKKSFVLHNKKVVRLNTPLFRFYSRYSGKFYSLITTRGCPFSCAYCCNSFFAKLYNRKSIRKRSVENVIEELKSAIKSFPDIVYINIQDDCFLAYDLDWLKKFASMYKETIRRDFVCRSTPVHITEEKIKILSDAGLSWVFMGLQTGSERVNRNLYKRYVSNYSFVEATKIIRKYNIAGYYDVILDNPYETDEDLIDTIKVLLKIPKPFELQICSLCFFQGTELYKRALEDNIKFENSEKKSFTKYAPTPLNKIIRLCPLLHPSIINFLVRNRKSLLVRVMIDLAHTQLTLLLEPIVWLRLILISFDYNFSKAMSMLPSFLKTGVSKMILRQQG